MKTIDLYKNILKKFGYKSIIMKFISELNDLKNEINLCESKGFSCNIDKLIIHLAQVEIFIDLIKTILVINQEDYNKEIKKYLKELN